MTTPHIADGEATFRVINVAPDFCEVEGKVVPFDIARTLVTEKSAYAKSVYSRGEKVMMVGSVIQGVDGNAGAGIFTGVSLGAGNVVLVTGVASVRAEGRQVSRHGELCWMNAP